MLRSGVLAFLLLFPIFDSVAADEFFAATVAVPDQNESSLRGAAAEALAQVLVRVSGDETLPLRPEADGVLSAAFERMALYSYAVGPAGVSVFIQFEEAFIKQTLQAMGAPYWSVNRPPVVGWIVVDEPAGMRFASPASDPDLLAALSAGFNARGVRFRLPLHDLEDAASIDPEAVARKNRVAIMAASQRYAPHILTGRVIPLSSGDWLADWAFLDIDVDRAVQSRADSSDALVARAVDMAVDAMAARYAVQLSRDGDTDGIAVRVTGVAGVADFDGVMAALRRIDVLQAVRIQAIRGDELQLRVAGVADGVALQRLLPRTGPLGVVGVGAGDDLQLIWRSP